MGTACKPASQGREGSYSRRHRSEEAQLGGIQAGFLEAVSSEDEEGSVCW